MSELLRGQQPEPLGQMRISILICSNSSLALRHFTQVLETNRRALSPTVP